MCSGTAPPPSLKEAQKNGRIHTLCVAGHLGLLGCIQEDLAHRPHPPPPTPLQLHTPGQFMKRPQLVHIMKCMQSPFWPSITCNLWREATSHKRLR